jgi:hypothetical protein
MIIAFSGTHSTGKTTMANEVYSSLPEEARARVELVTNLSRGCPHPLNREATEDTQAWIWNEYARLLESDVDGRVILCDRTIVDVMAYTLWLIRHRFKKDAPEWAADMTSRMSGDFHRLAVRRMTGWMYEAVLFVPPRRGAPVQADGTRDVDLGYRDEINRLMWRRWRMLSGCARHFYRVQHEQRQLYMKACKGHVLKCLERI